MPRTSARLFVAVDLPALVRRQLAAWTRGALARSGVSRLDGFLPRLVEPEMLHVTLCFLGSRLTQEIKPIAAAIATAARPVGVLSLGAPIWLPPRRPRALAIEVHDQTMTLKALRDATVHAVANVCGYEPQRGSFRAHITVARMREGTAPRERHLDATPELSFTTDALVLYRSWLSPSGASYEPIASVPLS
jgi:RNA 2',3'-cyclic 3'-phosphodiesterase